MSKNPKIIIIGAGFGGIKSVKSLHEKPAEVLLIDRSNYHNFQPLMYQVATGEPGLASIAYTVGRIFNKYKNVSLRSEAVTFIDWLINYISYGRPLELILKSAELKEEESKKQEIKE